MYRCMVSLLLIAGYLVSQMALIPHSHAGISADGRQQHDGTPHYHVGWHTHDDDGHRHYHGDHSHSHSRSHRLRTLTSPQSGSFAIADLGHNETAISLPLDATSLIGDPPIKSLSSMPLFAGSMGFLPTDYLESSGGQVRQQKSRAIDLDQSRLYLTLRTLRI